MNAIPRSPPIVAALQHAGIDGFTFIHEITTAKDKSFFTLPMAALLETPTCQ